MLASHWLQMVFRSKQAVQCRVFGGGVGGVVGLAMGGLLALLGMRSKVLSHHVHFLSSVIMTGLPSCDRMRNSTNKSMIRSNAAPCCEP